MCNHDYRIFRGKCMSWCTAIAEADSTMRLVKGFYHCPYNGKEEHAWLVHKETGTIVDPTANQFPSKGAGEYEEWDGKTWECEECGKVFDIENEVRVGRYHVCSQGCALALVGLM